MMEDHIARYVLIAQQPTTIGEPQGIRTAHPKALAELMRTAGFPARTDSDMEGWLISHAFFVTSVCSAIYLAGGDCMRLSSNRAAMELMVDAVREGFKTVHALGYAVHPIPLKVLFSFLPRPITIHYWQRFFSQPIADLTFGQHARHAVTEVRALAAECSLLLRKSGMKSPALHQLYQSIDEYAALSQTDQS